MQREIVTMGQAAAIPLTTHELAQLGLMVGDRVDVHSASGLIEITPVDRFSGLELEQLLSLVDARS